MKIKTVLSIVLCVLMICSVGAFTAWANDDTALPLSAGLEALQGQFQKGIGPETQGYAIDYRYYSPVGENDSTKYPLVVWLHGMGDGEYEGKQIAMHNMSYWTSAEYQSRFKNSGGAFIFAPRSLEEKELYWSDSLIYPLRSAIDDFISQHSDNIDVSRIYVGGYSMGGKMTLKMAVAYPEMFAAAFPICPAWAPEAASVERIADMPIWITSGKMDPLVNYSAYLEPTWQRITDVTNMPENCRLSVLAVTAYSNGVPCISGHYSWYAVNNDMFSSSNGNYPYMKTFDGNGDKVELTYPDGMISWLSGFESEYDGSAAVDDGNDEAKGPGKNYSFIDVIKNFFVRLFEKIQAIFR